MVVLNLRGKQGSLVFYVKMVSVRSVSLKTMLKPALIILLAPSLETSFFKCCPWQVHFREIKTAEELKIINIDIKKELERGKLFLVKSTL